MSRTLRQNHITEGAVPLGMPGSADELSYLEKKVLQTLGKLKKASPEELKAAGKFRELVEVMNAASWLQAKGLVTMKERVVHSFRLASPAAGRKALPERKALRALIKAHGKMSVPKLQAAGKFDDGELAVALGWLRRKGWADVAKTPEGSVVSVTPVGREAAGPQGADDLLPARPAKGELPDDAIAQRAVAARTSRRDFVQSAFWNFDALFQPQDHPARDQLDTFYLAKPSTLRLPDESTLGKVAEAHENGGGTGSTGWRYKWDRKEAERAVLRSHTTPVTLKWLMEHPKPPQKAFIIGRNFRPDATDWKHLPEFHQIEGVVMEEGANLAQLIGTIEAFYQRLGFTRVKFRPGYFPYTEPSMEPEGQTSDGRWMELGGSGIFRPEVTVPLGIDSPVLAWGLGLERLVMTIEGLSDIRQLYLSDLDWLRDHRAIL